MNLWHSEEYILWCTNSPDPPPKQNKTEQCSWNLALDNTLTVIPDHIPDILKYPRCLCMLVDIMHDLHETNPARSAAERQAGWHKHLKQLWIFLFRQLYHTLWVKQDSRRCIWKEGRSQLWKYAPFYDNEFILVYWENNVIAIIWTESQ